MFRRQFDSRCLVQSRVLPCHKSRNYQSCCLCCRWYYLIYYRNNNNNKAEAAVIKIKKWLSIWFIYMNYKPRQGVEPETAERAEHTPDQWRLFVFGRFGEIEQGACHALEDLDLLRCWSSRGYLLLVLLKRGWGSQASSAPLFCQWLDCVSRWVHS